MKHFVIYLFVLIAFLGTQIASGQHIGTSDTIVLNKKDVLKVLAKGYEAKALQAQRDLLLNQVDTLKARIVIKEMIIANLNGSIDNYKNIVSDKDAIISNHVDKEKIFQSMVNEKDKQIKKQRRAKKWTAFLGVLTTGAAIALYILK